MEVILMLISFESFNTIKMKFSQIQILVCCMKNSSKKFLTQFWRLKVIPKPFYDFIKMTIQLDPFIFHSWYLLFLIVVYSPF